MKKKTCSNENVDHSELLWEEHKVWSSFKEVKIGSGMGQGTVLWK